MCMVDYGSEPFGRTLTSWSLAIRLRLEPYVRLVNFTSSYFLMYFSKMHAMLPQDEASSTYATQDWSLCVVKWGREERTFRGIANDRNCHKLPACCLARGSALGRFCSQC